MGKLRGLPALSVADLMRLYRVSAKKSLSQNFILDEAVTGMWIPVPPHPRPLIRRAR